MQVQCFYYMQACFLYVQLGDSLPIQNMEPQVSYASAIHEYIFCATYILGLRYVIIQIA